MINNFNLFVDLVLDAEGGVSNDPDDRGGLTNRGITVDTLRNYINDVEDRDYPCGFEEAQERLLDLSEQDAIQIYQHYYWDAIYADELPEGVDIILADFAVNSGVYRATKIVQEMVNVRVDGILGPITLKAIQQRNPKKFALDLVTRRLGFYYQTAQLPNQAKFRRGWNIRVMHIYNELIKEGLC